jgi:hypothetical protein
MLVGRSSVTCIFSTAKPSADAIAVLCPALLSASSLGLNTHKLLLLSY